MASSFVHIFLSLLFEALILLYQGQVSSEEIRMRLVEEPINLGNQQWNAPSEPKALQPKVQPSNFSGPPHLQRLRGRCFTKVENNYKYELCPFQNVTQHEQSMRWNPYSGILGVYEEWEIVNNTFQSMVFRDGDECGQKNRQVKVELKCGTRHEIGDVSEPHTCEYHMVFNTPLVCHRHSLLVYPVMDEDLQAEWNELEGRKYREEITQKGYNKMLHKIFESAGFVLDPKQKPVPAPKQEDDEFTSLDTCKEEYNKLKTEVERLKSQLEIGEMEPDDLSIHIQRDHYDKNYNLYDGL